MSVNSDKVEIIFFGTGTSHGVPVMMCDCKVCRSEDKRDKRFRSSLLYQKGDTKILIDCGPDFRSQFLAFGTGQISAVLLTHIHYDHVGGLDDLRPFSYKNGLDVYASDDTVGTIREKSPYLFKGAAWLGLPVLRFHILMPYMPVVICGVEVVPFTVFHGKMPILGYKIGDFAYMTDAATIPDETIRLLKDIRVLVVNALRILEHPSHLSLRQALDVIKKTGAETAYLTHMSHNIGLHEQLERDLPPDVHPAYDGLKIEID